MELSADLPAPLVPLAWLVGSWAGAGVVGYPTIQEEARFGQEVELTQAVVNLDLRGSGRADGAALRQPWAAPSRGARRPGRLARPVIDVETRMTRPMTIGKK